MRKRGIIWICSLLLLTAATTDIFAQNISFGEYEIQAGFIYKFISFVEWPKDALSKETFVIGILGENPFKNAFEELKGQQVKDRTIEIKYFNSGIDYETLNQCHLLYISKSEEKNLSPIFDAIENQAVLTIGDSDHFAKQGGVIGFVKKNSKVAFEINNTSAVKANLDIRSMLKRIAVQVINEQPTKGDQ